ncbi:C-type mannose receptor 2-like isoform 1-T1 [Syngnathus typhle]
MSLPTLVVALVLTLCAWITLCGDISCDSGWEVFGSSCYKKMPATNGWLGARLHCALEGGDLVSFNSLAEEDFVKGKMGVDPFWIGLSNLECGHKLCHRMSGKEPKWSDDTPLIYSNWDAGQAVSTTSESCAYVKRKASDSDQCDKWRTGLCESSLAYICKRSPDGCPDGQPCSKKADRLALSPVQTSACDPGYLLYGPFCYRYFLETEKTWQAAEDDCVARGGHLASLHSHEDGKWMLAHTGIGSWLGLHKTSNKFEWTDKTSSDLILWHPGNPGNDLYGALSGTGIYTGSSPRRYICQKAKSTSPPPPLPAWSDKCGWEWLDNPANDFCYLMRGNQLKSWKEARDDCNRHNAHLLSITDSHEQAFVHGHSKAVLTTPSLWLDADAPFAESGGRWADGSPFSYVHLSAGHHGDKVGGRCLSFLIDNGDWKFDVCEIKRGYICKRRAATAQQAPLPHAGFLKQEICENADNRAICPEDRVMRIQSAFYGRRSSNVCSAQRGSDAKCTVEGALLHYRKECDNCHQCLVKPMKEDPCPEVSKYLQMVYTCETDECFDSLGNTQGSLKKLKLRASSSLSGFGPDKACLNGKSCWKPLKPMDSWIEVDLGEMKKVTGMEIQMCPWASSRHWSRFKMTHSLDGQDWTGHSQMLSPGATQTLMEPMLAQFIRILPLDHQWIVGLRFDVLGCALDNVISCDEQFVNVALDKLPTTVFCPPGCAKLDHQVYGTWGYKEESHICAAAIHAGVIADKTGGKCTLLKAPPQKSFQASEQNGILSKQLNQEGPLAFTFADGEMRCLGPEWEEFAGFCYKIFEDKKTWAEAQHACGTFGAQLVSVGSLVEQEWLKTTLYFDDSDTWTGLNDLAVPGMFVWSDRRPVTLTFWAAGEPNNELPLDDNCVAAAFQTGRWMRMLCTQLNRFVCKMPKAHYTIAAGEPETESGDSKALSMVSTGTCKDLVLEMMKGLQVGSTITIKGQGNDKTKSFQASLLNADNQTILQLKLDAETQTVVLSSQLDSDPDQQQLNQLHVARIPLQRGVDFKIVISCAQHVFRVLAGGHRLHYAYQGHLRLADITLLRLHGDVSLKVVRLATAPPT